MLTVDLPGHGETDVMSLDDFTTSLLKQLPDRFAVLGWSLGGLYALNLCQQATTRVQHLTAVATSPCFIKSDDWPGIEPSVLMRFYRNYSRAPLKTVQDFIELQFLHHPKTSITQYQPVLPSNAEYGLTLLNECDFRAKLTDLRCSISFILGQQDAIVPVALAKNLQNQFDINDVQVLKQCGHMPFLTHTDAFIHHLKERLK